MVSDAILSVLSDFSRDRLEVVVVVCNFVFLNADD